MLPEHMIGSGSSPGGGVSESETASLLLPGHHGQQELRDLCDTVLHAVHNLHAAYEHQVADLLAEVARLRPLADERHSDSEALGFETSQGQESGTFLKRTTRPTRLPRRPESREEDLREFLRPPPPPPTRAPPPLKLDLPDGDCATDVGIGAPLHQKSVSLTWRASFQAIRAADFWSQTARRTCLPDPQQGQEGEEPLDVEVEVLSPYAPAAPVNLEEMSSDEKPAQEDASGSVSTLRTELSHEGDPLYATYFNRVGPILRSVHLEIAMNLLIICNIVTLGLVMDNALTGAPDEEKTGVYVVDAVLTVLFVLELLLRCTVFPLSFLPTSVAGVFNLADAAIILVPAVVKLVSSLSENGRDAGITGQIVQVLMIFRFARLARFARIAQKSEWLKSINVFMRGMAGAPVPFLSGVLMLLLTTYAFALLGIVAISYPIKAMLANATSSDEVSNLQLLANYTGTLSMMMFTLSQVLSGQITATPFIPLVEQYLGWSWLYFHTYQAVMQLVILNLITATLVDQAIGYHQQEMQEKEEKEKLLEAQRQMADLGALFELLDEDGDGTLTWTEFKKGMKHEGIKKKWLALNYSPEEARTCFRVLDSNGEGVPINDFFEGLKRMQGAAQSRDLLQVLMLMHELRRALGASAQLRQGMKEAPQEEKEGL